MDVFALEWASDPQISPDGAQVAYVRQSFDIKSDSRRRLIWLVDRDGGNHRPLAGGSTKQASPRWSPDGKRLAFVSTDGDGAQIHMHWFAQGVTARVTNLLDAPTGLTWSPDGRHLAFVMRVPEKRVPLKVDLPEAPKDAKWAEPLKVIDRMVYRADGEGFLPDAFAQAFVVSADGGTARQLTEGAWDHDGVAWSADGTEILVSANRHENADLAPADSEIHAVDVTTGAMRALTRRFGPDTDPAVSPDGKYIAYTGLRRRLPGLPGARLYVMRRDNGEIRELAAELDRDVQRPTWSRDGRRIYFQYDDQGTTRSRRVRSLPARVTNLVGRPRRRRLVRPYGGGSFSVARDGSDRLHANDALRSRARSASFDGGKSRRLTRPQRRPARGARARHGRGDLEHVLGRRAPRPGLADPPARLRPGEEVSADPRDPRRAVRQLRPALRGRDAALRRGRLRRPLRQPARQHQLRRGVRQPDPPRLSGPRLRRPDGGVDAVLARGYVDERQPVRHRRQRRRRADRWIIGKTDRFRAAVVAKPVINWYSFVLTADICPFFSKLLVPRPALGARRALPEALAAVAASATSRRRRCC